jgi:hypothetical protein
MFYGPQATGIKIGDRIEIGDRKSSSCCIAPMRTPMRVTKAFRPKNRECYFLSSQLFFRVKYENFSQRKKGYTPFSQCMFTCEGESYLGKLMGKAQAHTLPRPSTNAKIRVRHLFSHPNYLWSFLCLPMRRSRAPRRALPVHLYPTY